MAKSCIIHQALLHLRRTLPSSVPARFYVVKSFKTWSSIEHAVLFVGMSKEYVTLFQGRKVPTPFYYPPLPGLAPNSQRLFPTKPYPP